MRRATIRENRWHRVNVPCKPLPPTAEERVHVRAQFPIVTL